MKFDEWKKLELERVMISTIKCLPHLVCINLTLLFVEYFSVFGQKNENKVRNLKKAVH